MTAVRSRASVEPGEVTDLSDIRPPTDVMAITSLPMTPSQSSGFLSPFDWLASRHLPPGAATRHLKYVSPIR
jgi:hypothetical protein